MKNLVLSTVAVLCLVSCGLDVSEERGTHQDEAVSDSIYMSGEYEFCTIDSQDEVCRGGGQPRYSYLPGEPTRGIVEWFDGTLREVDYEVIDGVAVYEGDILLGSVDEVEARAHEAREKVGPTSRDVRWPNKIIYYNVELGHPLANEINTAVSNWNNNTKMTLVPRTTQTDYVRFVSGTGCSSNSIGKLGGVQYITLQDGFATSSIKGMAIAKSNDWVYTWDSSATAFAGSSSVLGAYRNGYSFSLPPGLTVSQIVTMASHPTSDRVYTWYSNGTFSIGKSNDLDYYAGTAGFTTPTGYTISQILGVGIDNSGQFFTWMSNGNYFRGTASDLDSSGGPWAFSVASGYTHSQVVDMDFSNTGYVYVWYDNRNVSAGTAADLDSYRTPYNYETPGWCGPSQITHEIGHAVGLDHEHNRLDRDSFVIYYPDRTGNGSQFVKKTAPAWRDFYTFDFNSLMIYGSYDFALDPALPVLTTLTGGTWAQPTSLSSGDLQSVRELYGYSAAKGYLPSTIVGVGIAKSNDRVYAWYSDLKVSNGLSTDTDYNASVYNYTLPSGYTTGMIVAMAISNTSDRVYTWYTNGKVSVGTSSDLDYFTAPYNYVPASGYSISQIRAIGIAPDNKVYTWYSNYKRSIGTSSDLDYYGAPVTYSVPSGFKEDEIVDIDIAGSSSYVYIWWDENDLTVGTSTDLDYYQAPW